MARCQIFDERPWLVLLCGAWKERTVGELVMIASLVVGIKREYQEEQVGVGAGAEVGATARSNSRSRNKPGITAKRSSEFH